MSYTTNVSSEPCMFFAACDKTYTDRGHSIIDTQATRFKNTFRTSEKKPKNATTCLDGGVDTSVDAQNQAAHAKFLFCSLTKTLLPVQASRSSLIDLLKLIFPEAQVPLSKVQC